MCTEHPKKLYCFLGSQLFFFPSDIYFLKIIWYLQPRSSQMLAFPSGSFKPFSLSLPDCKPLLFRNTGENFEQYVFYYFNNPFLPLRYINQRCGKIQNLYPYFFLLKPSKFFLYIFFISRKPVQRCNIKRISLPEFKSAF